MRSPIVLSSRCRLLAQQPILNEADVAGINYEYTNRLRTLLSVDDLIGERSLTETSAALGAGSSLVTPCHSLSVAMADYLISIGEWDNTYFFYTSDHVCQSYC